MEKKKKIAAVYFSPTGSTKKIVERIADGLAAAFSGESSAVDLTLPAARLEGLRFSGDETVVFGVPVYGGRIPVLMVEPMARMEGNGATAIAVAVYGNRHYDDALLETADRLAAAGFSVAAAGAFSAEHSLTAKVGTARPDASDLTAAAAFAAAIAKKIAGGLGEPPRIPGNRPYKEVAFPPVRPVTSMDCVRCMQCVAVCPLGIIDGEDPALVGDGCVYCCACVKECPQDAKSFGDEYILQRIELLEAHCRQRREPETFV